LNRLGRWGAKRSIGLPDGVFHADVTGLNDQEGLKNRTVNHWYYIESPSVVTDIHEVLKGEYSLFTA
jgi:hypothetical protein